MKKMKNCLIKVKLTQTIFNVNVKQMTARQEGKATEHKRRIMCALQTDWLRVQVSNRHF